MTRDAPSAGDDLPIDLPMDQLRSFCRRWQIQEFALFGSVLRSDFGPESDLDLLVRFVPAHQWSVLDHIRMERELGALVGRRAEIVNADALAEDSNQRRRDTILRTARTLHAA